MNIRTEAVEDGRGLPTDGGLTVTAAGRRYSGAESSTRRRPKARHPRRSSLHVAQLPPSAALPSVCKSGFVDAGHQPRGMGLSLSGGGHRATMSSLGGLLAVVDGGVQDEVRWIASVSGGSLTNAFVATRCDFRKVEAGVFDAIAQEALELVANHGTLLGTRAAKGRALAGLLGAALSSVYVARRSAGSRRLDRLGQLASCIPFVALLRARGWLVERSIDEVWCTPWNGASAEFVGPPVPEELGYSTEEFAALIDAPDTPTEHVFVSTDLLRGQPIYVTQHVLVSDGIAMPLGRIAVARAVRASASFPGLLPPVRLSPERHVQRPPSMAPRKRLLAIDGGVYNNLASEWRDSRQSGDHDRVFRPPSLFVPVALQLVVDAGAPLRPSRGFVYDVPVVGLLYTLWRIATVMYHSGLDGRRGLLREMSPHVFHAETVTIPGRAAYERQYLPDAIALNKKFWVAVTEVAEHVETTLRRLRRAEAVSLVAVGYANAVAALVRSGHGKGRFGRAWNTWLRDEVVKAIPGAGKALDEYVQLPR